MASSSRSLLRRIMPLLRSHIRHSHGHGRLLGSAAPQETSTSAAGHEDGVRMTENCIRRMKELHAKEESSEGKMLRLSVETGGCSGFQYVFGLDNKRNEDDRVFEKEGIELVVDNISYDFVKGATVDYVEELIRSAFVDVFSNPSVLPVDTYPFSVWHLLEYIR